MNWKHLVTSIALICATTAGTALAAELSIEPMATTQVGANYEHRIWATTTSGHLAAFSQADNSWRSIRGDVRGGVAAVSFLVDDTPHERVFVPGDVGITDTTLSNLSITQSRTLNANTGESFSGSDVGIIHHQHRLFVAAISTTGKLCVWMGQETSALIQIYCSGEGMADPLSAIAEKSYNQKVFFFRGQSGSLHALHISPFESPWGTLYFANDHDIGVPPATTSIGPAVARYHHAAANRDHIAVVANNRLWVARYRASDMSVSWDSLGAPPTPPKAHRSALHMDGTWYTSFTSDRTHCSTLITVIGQNGDLYFTSGKSSTFPTAACSDSSYSGNAWQTYQRLGLGRWTSNISTTTHQSGAFRWIKHYAMNQLLFGWPHLRVTGNLMEYTPNGWESRGNP